MNKFTAVFGVVLASCLYAAPSHAQSRTWVSGVGDDLNPCSRTAPCKTFAGAISKTAAFGEINCLDSGGFGTVTITKSITIKCEGVIGGVLGAGTTGINVNDSASATPGTAIVTLSGLDLEGFVTGINGINFTSGAVLHVHKVQIRGFRGGGSGIALGGTGAKQLNVAHSYITDNGNSLTTAGISIIPTGTGSAKVVVDNTHIAHNTNGIRASGVGSTGGIRVTVRDSAVVGNSTNGFTATSPGGAVIGMYVERSTSASNQNGVVSDGNQAFINLNGNGIVNNTGAGLATSNGGTIASFTTPNNAVIANSPDGNPTNNALTFK